MQGCCGTIQGVECTTLLADRVSLGKGLKPATSSSSYADSHTHMVHTASERHGTCLCARRREGRGWTHNRQVQRTRVQSAVHTMHTMVDGVTALLADAAAVAGAPFGVAEVVALDPAPEEPPPAPAPGAGAAGACVGSILTDVEGAAAPALEPAPCHETNTHKSNTHVQHTDDSKEVEALVI